MTIFALRRNLLARPVALAVLAVLLLGMRPCPAAAERDEDSPGQSSQARIVFIADSHVGYGPGQRNLERAAQILTSGPSPNLIVAGGDLTERGLEDEYQEFFRITKDVRAPIISIPGNHDARWKGKPLFAGLFGKTYRSMDLAGYHLVLLDTAPAGQSDAYIDEAQFKWLEGDLKAMRAGTPVIVFSHHPVKGGGLENEDRLLTLFSGYNSVLFVAGHGHANTLSVEGGVARVMDAGILEGTMLSISLAQSGVNVSSVSLADGTQSQVVSVGRSVQIPPAAKPHFSVTNGMLKASVETSTSNGVGLKLGSRMATLVADSGVMVGELNIADLPPGRHSVTVRTQNESKATQVQVSEVSIPGGTYSVAWEKALGQTIVGMSASNGVAYVAGQDGRLVALDFATGHEKWAVDLQAPAAQSPLVVGGYVVIGATNGTIRAFHARNGSLAWEQTGYKGLGGTPATDGSKLYLTSGKTLHALDLTSGAPLWTFTHTSELAPVLTAGDGRVFVGSYDGSLVCVSRDGARLWQAPVESTFYHSPVFSAPALGGGLVVVGTPLNTKGTGHTVHAFDVRDGSKKWSLNAGSTVAGIVRTGAGFLATTLSPRVARIGYDGVASSVMLPQGFGGAASYGPGFCALDGNGVYAAMDSEGYLYTTDVKGAEVVTWIWSTGANSYVTPVCSDGTILVGDVAGRVCALRSRVR